MRSTPAASTRAEDVFTGEAFEPATTMADLDDALIFFGVEPESREPATAAPRTRELPANARTKLTGLRLPDSVVNHSPRTAVSGSTLGARPAGRRQAAKVTQAVTMRVVTSVAGSLGSIR